MCEVRASDWLGIGNITRGWVIGAPGPKRQNAATWHDPSDEVEKIPAVEMMTGNAGRCCGREVRRPVADQEASASVGWPVFEALQDHSWCWLAQW